MNIVKNSYMGGGKNKGIILLKFIAAFLIAEFNLQMQQNCD